MKNLRKYFIVTIVNIMAYLILSYGINNGKLELLHVPALIFICLFVAANSKQLPEE